MESAARKMNSNIAMNEYGSQTSQQPSTLRQSDSLLVDGKWTASKKPTLFARIGGFGFTVVFLGLLLELAVLGLLGYLWSQRPIFGASPTHEQSLWRSIVLNDGWITRTVTIVTAVVRVILSQQAILCTSLAAALLLEKRSVGIPQVAGFSILRAFNSGPWDAMTLMFQDLTHYIGSLPAILVAILFLTNIALQFSSTLLVSDFGNINIVSPPETKTVDAHTLGGNFVRMTRDSIWQKSLGTYPTFAESRSNASFVNSTLSDSGGVQRALLPFDADQRLQLRSYLGPAVVQESRTVCIPATGLQANFSNTYGGADQLALQGTIAQSTELFNLSNIPRDLSQPINKTFECPYLYSSYGTAVPGVQGDTLQASLCNLASGFETLLVIRSDANYTRWYDGSNFALELLSSNGSWAYYQPSGSAVPGSNASRPILEVSLCMAENQFSLAQISVSALWETQEPTLGSQEKENNGWAIDPIISLYGSSSRNETAEQRGILSLNSADSSNINQTSETVTTLGSLYGTWISSGGDNSKMALVFDTKTNNYQTDGFVHPAHILILGAALNATNNLAASLDTLWAIYAQTLYYENFGFLDDSVGIGSTMLWYTTVTAPVRWTGFTVVAALLLVTIAIMVLLLGMFAWQTEGSFRRQAWHAVAQLFGEDTEEVMAAATRMTDHQVAAMMRERGVENILMTTGRNVVTGRTEVVNRTVFRT
ncbi:hypothetical protein BX600DRAFT_551602 [Xylariales sp. PMI_506]|nr:hypothetical protein BX600DRAFT_551602 [Xylariales sp. PMI_506]